MEEKMIHRLPIPLPHTTLINHNGMPLPESEKGRPKGNLRLLNILPRERSDIVASKDKDKDTIVGAYVKQPFSGRGPQKD